MKRRIAKVMVIFTVVATLASVMPGIASAYGGWAYWTWTPCPIGENLYFTPYGGSFCM